MLLNLDFGRWIDFRMKEKKNPLLQKVFVKLLQQGVLRLQASLESTPPAQSRPPYFVKK